MKKARGGARPGESRRSICVRKSGSEVTSALVTFARGAGAGGVVGGAAKCPLARVLMAQSCETCLESSQTRSWSQAEEENPAAASHNPRNNTPMAILPARERRFDVCLANTVVTSSRSSTVWQGLRFSPGCAEVFGLQHAQVADLQQREGSD